MPAGTILLIMEDIDVPKSRPSIHLIALFAPETDGFAEGELTPDNPRIRYVPTHRGRIGYIGPRALPGHGLHHYGFHLYALDQTIPNATAIAGLDELLQLIDGHVIAQGFLEGVQSG